MLGRRYLYAYKLLDNVIVNIVSTGGWDWMY